MNLEERLAFVRAHRTAVFGVNRSTMAGNVIVYYVMDGNDLWFRRWRREARQIGATQSERLAVCAR